MLANLDDDAARLARRKIDVCIAAWPDEHACTNTLAALQYRCGEYEPCLTTLNRAMQQRRAVGKPPHACDLAMQAMALAHRGLMEQARASLRAAQAAIRQPEFAHDQETAGFLRDAESLLD